MDSHHFLLGEILLDMNLYRLDQKDVSSKWATNLTKLAGRIFVKGINAIYESHKGTCIVDTNRSITVVIIKRLMGIFVRLLPQNIPE